jgi:hypothetical protein
MMNVSGVCLLQEMALQVRLLPARGEGPMSQPDCLLHTLPPRPTKNKSLASCGSLLLLLLATDDDAALADNVQTRFRSAVTASSWLMLLLLHTSVNSCCKARLSDTTTTWLFAEEDGRLARIACSALLTSFVLQQSRMQRRMMVDMS